MIVIFLVLLLIEGLTSTSGFVARHAVSKANVQRVNYLKMMSGYVPPEEDEDYRGNVQKSRQRPVKVKDINGDIIGNQQILPIPCEGDIVLCPGKYKNERILARIRFLQYLSASNDWIADLAPLKEGKSVDIL